MSQPGYVCPRCAMISFNPNDLINRYCGHCHRFEDETDREADADAYEWWESQQL